jgi:hypothetical protein
MRKRLKETASQFTLFPPPARTQHLPQEVHPKTVVLLARMLRQYLMRNAVSTRLGEHGNE